MSSARIPVRNLYYLLAYAWESFPESEESKLGLEVCPDLINLLAKLLCQQVQRLVRRGLEKRYLSQLETGVRISGRIALTETSRLKARHSPQVCFEIDELTSDILPNRILKSTLSQLRCSEQLASSLHDDVWRAFIGLPQVEEIRLTSAVFSKLLFHRNNRHYRLAIDICQLIHHLCLPDSSKRNEQRVRFLDIVEDEACMERIFEKFVLNFALAHSPESRPGSQILRWQGTWAEPDGHFLPRMQTDLTLDLSREWWVIDENLREILEARPRRS